MPTSADRQYRESGGLEPRTRRLDSHEDLVEGYLAEVVFSDDPRLADLVEAMRRNASREEVNELICDPELVRAAREYMESALEFEGQRSPSRLPDGTSGRCKVARGGGLRDAACVTAFDEWTPRAVKHR